MPGHEAPNDDAKRETLSAVALPVRELGGLIWLFTGAHPDSEPAIPEAFCRTDCRVTSQEFLWDVHWTRVMENMLDTPHLPFVRAKTIGKRLRGPTNEPMEMTWRETAHGAEITARRGGEETGARLRYHFPNLMEGWPHAAARGGVQSGR